MKTNPEKPKDWTLPPAFELPRQFRQSLPTEIQEWIDSVEQRIDGLTLERIQEEANSLDDALDEANGSDADRDPISEELYRLGQRIFYTRMQQIVDIMFPGQDVEVGVELLWSQVTNELPGAAVTTAVINGEGLNTGLLKQLKCMGFTLGGSSLM